MIIGIDASALTLPHPTGVQRYTEQIIKHMLKIGGHEFRLYTPKPLREPFAAHQVVITSPRFWTQLRLPIELFLHRPDVFFQPSYMLPPFCPCLAVVMVHDLAWLKFPQAYSATELRLHQLEIKRIKKHQVMVIVPSVSAKEDVLKLMHIHQDYVSVIPEALIELPRVTSDHFDRVKSHAGEQVILAIGRLEERKNTLTLVEAVTSLVVDQKQDLTLVLLGQAGFGADEIFAAIQKAKSSGVRIIHINDADDAELSDWLSIAKVYVYPSLYEGFGLPILQAFAAGAPVITAQNSSMPEVAGDAALYVKNAKDDAELAAIINSLLKNPAKAEKLIQAGKEQLKKFSWDKAAEETLKVFEAIYKTTKPSA